MPQETSGRGSYATRLLGRETVAAGTVAFRLAIPAGFRFQPGQYTIVHLPGATRLEGEDREHLFSIASAPGDPELLFATRVEGRASAWKRALLELPPGAPVELDPPGGKFVLPERPGPVAFLAAGIGITPVRSMLRHAAHTGFEERLALIYVNPTAATATFLDELLAIETQLRLTLVPVMTHDPSWHGEQGPVDAAMLARHLGDVRAWTHYASGPPQLVRALRAAALAAGVDRRALRVEEFAGY